MYLFKDKKKHVGTVNVQRRTKNVPIILYENCIVKAEQYKFK